MNNNKIVNRVCPVCGKIHTRIYKGNLCCKHYYQLIHYGKYLDNNPRTIYDPNEYEIKGNTTYITVYNKKGEPLDKTVIIDTEDLEKIIKYKIFVQEKSKNCFYAMCNIKKNLKIPVHKIVTDFLNVDHINGNSLDNRKENLRESTMTMQNLNKLTTKGIQKRVYTYKGQYIIKGYAATLGYNNKRYISKYYKTENEARYYRYLLLQLLPFKTNYDTSFMDKLTEEQRKTVTKDFENRFKNRVL